MENILRSGEYSPNTVEYPIDQLIPVHRIPRRGKEWDYQNLITDIAINGFNLQYPISVYVLPNAHSLICHGHHRTGAMSYLGANYVPANIAYYSDNMPGEEKAKVDFLIRLSFSNGLYRPTWYPTLNYEESQLASQYLSFYLGGYK